ncbi:hypothetical protein [Streptomyces sp. NPDC003943]
MIFRRKGRRQRSERRLLAAVGEFEAAVRADSRDVPAAFDALLRAFRETVDAVDAHGAKDSEDFRDAELSEAGPRLAALLPALGQGPDSRIAVMAGACVERGADPVACAPAVLDRVRAAFEQAGELAERWAADGRGAAPGPDGEGLGNEDYGRYGYGPIVAWRALPQFEAAGVAVLCSPDVRRSLPDREGHLAAVRKIAVAAEDRFRFTCLEYALAVLDDAPIVAVDRATGAGFALRASGIGDNLQLHTLLAHALVGGGHLPGRPPSAAAVARCRDRAGTAPTTGSFGLTGADGAWIPNEGNPYGIPVVDGVRLVVLGPPPYAMRWDAGRLFPRMTGDLVLERVLEPEESAALLAQVAEPLR